MKVFADHHHSSLTRSLVMLFEDRLGAEIFSPIGMEWFASGYWAINNQRDTAEQYLQTNSQPTDGTVPLTRTASGDDEVYNIFDPGDLTTHKGIRFETFKNMKFDYIIASILEHIPLYTDLIKRFQPQAKLIVQVGNMWDAEQVRGHNVLSSLLPEVYPADFNVCYYRQEFDTNIFRPDITVSTSGVSSYVNCLPEMKSAWYDFLRLEEALQGVTDFRSYGGQCRDGNMQGPQKLAESMQHADLVCYIKQYGDGYGHVAHNALACGKPLIYRRQYVAKTLVGSMLHEGNSIDLDGMTDRVQVEFIRAVLEDRGLLARMSANAYQTFKDHVDFAADAQRVKEWLETL